MQKHLFLIIVVLSVVLRGIAAHGQVKIGPETGVNFGLQRRVFQADSLGNTSENSNLKVGALAGVNVDIKLVKRCYLQTGLLYTYDNIKFKEPVDFSAQGLGSANAEQSYNLHYVRLPLYIMYKSGFEGSGRFIAGVGPYVSYAFLANQKTSVPYIVTDSNARPAGIRYEKTSTEMKIGNDPATNQLKTWDYGVNACIGYESNIGLFFRGSFNWGFQNLQPGGNSSSKVNNWGAGITIGYNIGRDDW